MENALSTFSKKTLIFPLDIPAGWDYIVNIPTDYLITPLLTSPAEKIPRQKEFLQTVNNAVSVEIRDCPEPAVLLAHPGGYYIQPAVFSASGLHAADT